MMWVFVAIGYVVAVASIIRFFQFVSETDRTIHEFWITEIKPPRRKHAVKKA